MIVVISEIRVAKFWKLFSFAALSQRIHKEAQFAKGNRHSSIKGRGLSKFYTRTGWETMENMRLFRNSGSHADAMKRATEYASSIKTMHWEGEDLPTWPEVFKKLDAASNVLKNQK